MSVLLFIVMIYSLTEDLVDAYRSEWGDCALESSILGAGDDFGTAIRRKGACMAIKKGNSRDRSSKYYSKKTLTGEYDKYGKKISNNGLVSNTGRVSKSALSRVLSSSMGGGLSLESLPKVSRFADGDEILATENLVTNNFLSGYSGDIGPDGLPIPIGFGTDDGILTDENMELGLPKVYKMSADAGIITGNPVSDQNIDCKFASDGFGYPHCKNDRTLGTHFDLTNMRGPYRVNAHFESPSEVGPPRGTPNSRTCEGSECKSFQCNGAECKYSQCEGAECKSIKCVGAECEYSQCKGSECKYSPCKSAKCKYSQCVNSLKGVVAVTQGDLLTSRILKALNKKRCVEGRRCGAVSRFVTLVDEFHLAE